MTAKAMDGLWAYLQTLSLTKKNREWLSARLIEPKVEPIEKNALDLAMDDIREGRVFSYNSLEDLIKDI